MNRAAISLLAVATLLPWTLLTGCAGSGSQRTSPAQEQTQKIPADADWRPDKVTPNHLALARDLVVQGHYSVAMAQLNQCLTTHGHDPEPHTLLGICHRETGDLKAAILSFERAIALDGEYAAAHGGLAIAYYMAGQCDAAHASMARAATLDPADANLQNNLGVLEMRGNRPSAAMGRFQQCLRIDPDHPSATNNLAECLVRLGRDREALALLARRFTPATAVSNLGAIYLTLHRPEAARKMFRRALARDPNLTPARRNLERMEKKEDDSP